MRADARRNRERVLEAAAELFAARGPGVPLDDIARHAGLGPGTVHRHFPSKESLVSAVVVDGIRATTAFGRTLVDAPDPGVALATMLERMIEAGRADAPLKAVLVADGIDLRTAAPDEAAALSETVGVLLRRAQEAGSVRRDLDTGDAMALVAGTFIAIQHAEAEQDPERAHRLLSVLLDGLRT